MTFPLDTDDVDRTPPQTESSEERGYTDEERADLGRDELFDPDDIGDIADEGPGHRG
jgi:hypothetical protein